MRAAARGTVVEAGCRGGSCGLAAAAGAGSTSRARRARGRRAAPTPRGASVARLTTKADPSQPMLQPQTPLLAIACKHRKPICTPICTPIRKPIRKPMSRRAAVERYLNRLAAHPTVARSEVGAGARARPRPLASLPCTRLWRRRSRAALHTRATPRRRSLCGARRRLCGPEARPQKPALNPCLPRPRAAPRPRPPRPCACSSRQTARCAPPRRGSRCSRRRRRRRRCGPPRGAGTGWEQGTEGGRHSDSLVALGYSPSRPWHAAACPCTAPPPPAPE